MKIKGDKFNNLPLNIIERQEKYKIKNILNNKNKEEFKIK